MRWLRIFLITAAIAAVMALLIIGGCSSQQQPKPVQKAQPQAAAPQEQPQPAPAAEAKAATQQQPQDDIYKDNQNQSLDELSQLE